MTSVEKRRSECNEFHRAHPEEWALFCHYTKELIAAGRRRGSAYAVFERIRWESEVNPTMDGGFKLNNNYRKVYATAWMKLNPQYSGFFKTREKKE